MAEAAEPPTEENNNGEENLENGQSHKCKSTTQTLIYDNVCHYRKESVLTKFSDDLKLDGFKNFIYLILIISCSRLAFENISVYGFKANPFRWLDYIMWDPLSRPTFFLLILLHFFILTSLILEKCYISFLYGNQRARKFADGTSKFETNDRGESIFKGIYILNLIGMMLLPIFVSTLFTCNPYLLSFICLLYSATFLKLYSFHQVNSWWRTGKIYGRTIQDMPNFERLESKASSYVENILNVDQKTHSLVLYPQNLTFGNIIYYFYVPTLCYQLNYPRKKTINYYFVLRSLLEFLFLIELETVLFEQWVIVPLQQKQFTFDELSVHDFLLKWTKMSLGTISIWLVGFYSLFQSMCNLSAELFRFADRDFYGDWWNATTIGEFWRNWNLPVHRWCVRHLFKPLIIERGYSKVTTAFIVFFVSGIFHEYLVSVPMGRPSIHFLMSMTAQMVLDLATAHIHKTNAKLANMIVWLSLILGQSMLILLYYNDMMIVMRTEAAVSVAVEQ